MSTRSGKRIHNSISENVESVSEKQIEKNTRSKRVKENSGEVTTGKKKNFVRRPSNDEVESSIDKTGNTSKSVRKSKRHTLKELNLPADGYEALSVRKSMRQSRRTRKEDHEPTNLFVLETNELKIETKEKKKNKKKRAVIENLDNEPVKAIITTKKKTHKKKKKSNSFTVEEVVTGEHCKSFNKSNVSIDSFHSAAGSPDKCKDDVIKIDDKLDKSGCKEESKSPTLFNPVENLKDTKKKSKKSSKTDSQFKTSIDKAVKLCALNDLFESSINKKEEIRDENVNRFERDISGTSKTKTKQRSKKKKSLSDTGNTQGKADLIPSLELHDSVKANICSKDLNNETVVNINSPISNFDFINIKHFKGTVNELQNISHLNISSKKSRKSTSLNSTFDKMDKSITPLNECNKDMSENFIDKSKVQLDEMTTNNTTQSECPTRSKSKDETYEKINLSNINLDQTFDKTNNSFNINSNAVKELTHSGQRNLRRKSSIKNATFDKIYDNFVDTDTTFNKESSNSAAKSRRSSGNSLPQGPVSIDSNGTYDKIIKDRSSFCNNTYDKLKLDTTFEKTKEYIDGDITKNVNPKISIISSDNTDNMTSDMSEECSRISLVSDESKTENIINTTPLLIESSMEESQINSPSMSPNKTTTPRKKEALTNIVTSDEQGRSSDNNKTPLKRETFTETKATPLKRDGTYTELRTTPSKHRSSLIKEHETLGRENPTTPLQREGTFTKEIPDVMSPKPNGVDKTPIRRGSMPSPGRTPFCSSGSGSRGRIALNMTHSIEKPQRRSSAGGAPPRPTRVMFRSPVDDPVAVAEIKGKIIKSNLKGSSKSFMFDESASKQCGSRKRSRTHGALGGASTGGGGAGGGGAKRSRTGSAAARLQAPAEAAVTWTASQSSQSQSSQSQSQSDVRPARPRTMLPDFAALHRKQFSKMESLDECQQRHARRARALLTPTAQLTPTASLAPTAPLAPTASLTPIAPSGAHNRNNNKETSDATGVQAAKKPVTQKCKEVDKKTQSYTRFGFKLNLDVNPFSVPAKTTDVHPKDVIKPKVLKRQATLPSLAGATAAPLRRKEAAKQAVMREKTFTDKRDLDRSQNRTVIKGVRTNRRFELQMKMRNID